MKSNSVIIRWLKDKSIKRAMQFLALNTWAALVVSGWEELTDSEWNNFWDEFLDRFISYNIAWPILWETNEQLWILDPSSVVWITD
jgi:hypothetical protein